MLTIRQYLNRLPNDLKKAAFANIRNQALSREEYQRKLATATDSLSSAISSAFLWIDTPEGPVFWYKIKKKYDKVS